MLRKLYLIGWQVHHRVTADVVILWFQDLESGFSDGAHHSTRKHLSFQRTSKNNQRQSWLGIDLQPIGLPDVPLPFGSLAAARHVSALLGKATNLALVLHQAFSLSILLKSVRKIIFIHCRITYTLAA